MKVTIYLALTICFALFFGSCDSLKDISAPKLIFRDANIFSSTYKNNTVVFTSHDIKSYNSVSGELIFSDSGTVTKLKNYISLTCYHDTDSLFSFRLTSNIMSSIVNDLVLNHNLNNGKYYLNDGYPDWIDNIGTTSLRSQNKLKRAAAWEVFINQLKLEGKYKDN